MSKHTPGPWHVVTSYEYSGKEPAGAKPERPRYSIGHGPDDPIQRSFVNTQYDLNNARLIAAAPEMYEMLKLLHSEGCASDAFPGRSCDLCTLLAKAEGREP